MSRTDSRVDYEVICQLVPERARVLDLGCGDGTLLELLTREKNVRGQGIEIDRELARKSIRKGLTVLQDDLESGLKEYPDKTFDYVIMNQTLQAIRRPFRVMMEMMRVGENAVVGFPNFGHFRLRLDFLLSGRMPKSPNFPYEWYETPNIHPFTIEDFENLIAEKKIVIRTKKFLGGNRFFRNCWPNLFAKSAVFVLGS